MCSTQTRSVSLVLEPRSFSEFDFLLGFNFYGEFELQGLIIIKSHTLKNVLSILQLQIVLLKITGTGLCFR